MLKSVFWKYVIEHDTVFEVCIAASYPMSNLTILFFFRPLPSKLHTATELPCIHAQHFTQILGGTITMLVLQNSSSMHTYCESQGQVSPFHKVTHVLAVYYIDQTIDFFQQWCRVLFKKRCDKGDLAETLFTIYEHRSN